MTKTSFERGSQSPYLAGIALLVFLLCSIRLGVPSHPVFDEVYYLPAARSLLAGKPDPNWVHPPLAKLLMAASIRILGDRALAWRLPSVLALVLAVSFFFLLSHELLGRISLSCLASFLYAVDGISYVQGRIGTLDMMMTGFLLPSIYFFAKKRYFISSIFLGLSLSCKWGGVFILPFYLLFLPRDSIKEWGKAALEITLPSLALYLVIFSSLSAGAGHWVRSPLWENAQMLRFHLRPSMQHPYKAPWWKWVLLIRPIWYDYRQNGAVVRGIVCLPNPLVWWPALIAALLLFFRLKDEAARFILAGFLFLTIPWIISVKGGFMYYLLPASPFLVLALAYWLRENRLAAWFAAAAAAIGFALFFPLYAYLPISYSYFYRMMWLPSWI